MIKVSVDLVSSLASLLGCSHVLICPSFMLVCPSIPVSDGLC